MFEIAGNMDDSNRPYRVKIKVENEGGELSKDEFYYINCSLKQMTQP